MRCSAKISVAIVSILCICISYSAMTIMVWYNLAQALSTVNNSANSTNSIIDVTRTKAFGPPQIIQSEPTGDNTNRTNLVTEGQQQIITNQSASMRQIIPPTQPGQGIGGITLADIANMNISKEEAAKAEKQSNVMLETYYEDLEEKNETSALAQPNETMGVLQEETRCVAGEVSTQVGNSTVCLSPYEISIACNQGGSLFGDPVCSGSAGVSSTQQPGPGQSTPEEEVIDETAGQGQQPGSGEEEVLEEGDAGEQQPGPGQTTPAEEEVIDETAGQGQQPGSGEEEVLEEGDAGEQEVIEDFQ